MKRIVAALSVSSLVFLTGCFGGDPQVPMDGSVEKNRFSTSDFSISLPIDWEVLSEFDNSYPSNTIVAVRNHVKENSFVANVTVTYNIIDGDMDVRDFAAKMLTNHQSSLVNFKEISKGDIQISVNGNPATTVMNVFEGKTETESQTLRFLQTHGYKGNIAYIVTGAYNLSEEQFAREKVETVVRSLQIR